MKNFLKKRSREWAIRQKKRQDRNSKRQKNKKGESKVESKDSPEMPDRRETSDIPGLPLGSLHLQHLHTKKQTTKNNTNIIKTKTNDKTNKTALRSSYLCSLNRHNDKNKGKETTNSNKAKQKSFIIKKEQNYA